MLKEIYGVNAVYSIHSDNFQTVVTINVKELELFKVYVCLRVYLNCSLSCSPTISNSAYLFIHKADQLSQFFHFY